MNPPQAPKLIKTRVINRATINPRVCMKLFPEEVTTTTIITIAPVAPTAPNAPTRERTVSLNPTWGNNLATVLENEG
jgi:hypothetical protein